MNRDDSLWKAILEDIFDDFLRFFIPDADRIFDLHRGFLFLDKELEQLFPPDKDEYAPKHVDKLVQVFTREGNEEWILIHVEVQGYYEKTFSKRMFTYFSRIFDKYDRPITAFALLTDDVRSFRPDSFERSFLGTSLTYMFNSYKVLDQSPDELRASSNPFASVVLTVQTALKKKKLTEEVMLDLKVQLARDLLIKKFSKDKIRVLMDFLRYYIRFEKADNRAKFEKEIDQITNHKPTMGLEQFLLERALREGRQEGRQEGKQEEQRVFVTNMIRKTQFTDEQIAEIAETSVANVAQLRQQIAGGNA